jgi:hypothetical protein
LLYERLVRRLPTRFPLFYLERGSIDHLMRDTEKSRACAIAPDLLEQNILVNERSPLPNNSPIGSNFSTAKDLDELVARISKRTQV